jgi:steroid 5-alpha reductase family enzyme
LQALQLQHLMTESAGTSERGVLKDYVRGLISNGVALGLLYAISCIPGMRQYVCLSLALQWGVFIVHALPNTSEKFYDLSGSATHFSLVAVSLCSAARVHTPRQLLIAILSIVWMTRLGTFLFLRISRDGKDERFDSLKRVWLSWLGAWTIQALWVTLIQLPVVLVNDRDDVAPLGLTDALALALWVAGFLLETLADVQKFVFRADAANRHRYITSGLWRLCRHPNYCGEIAMWVAMAASVSSAGLAARLSVLHFAWLSPAFTALLLLRVSGVPMVEAAGQKKWGTEPAYRHYMERTAMIIPWWPAPPFEKVS